jgi:hypothetical protein
MDTYARSLPPITDQEIIDFTGLWEYAIIRDEHKVQSPREADATALETWGQGRNAVRFRKYIANGQAYAFEMERRSYFDPIKDMPDDQIRKVAFNNCGTSLVIEEPAELAEAIRLIRSNSYVLDVRQFYRRFVVPGRPKEILAPAPRLCYWGTGCNQFVTVWRADGTGEYWEWLGHEARAYRHTEGLLESFAGVAKKRGWRMESRPGSPMTWFVPPDGTPTGSCHLDLPDRTTQPAK